MDRCIQISMLVASTAACGGGSDGGTKTSAASTSANDPYTVVSADAVTHISPTTGCRVTQLLGDTQDTGLEIHGFYWAQVVQQAMADSLTRLAANKPVLVRVDVTSPNNAPLPARARLVLGSRNGDCREYTLISDSSTAPTTVDPRTLAYSYTTTIPAAEVSDHLGSYQLVVDPDSRSTRATADRLYRSGPLVVLPAMSERILIRPMTFAGRTGVLPGTDNLIKLLGRALPQSSISISKGEDFAPAGLSTTSALATRGTGSDTIYTFSFDQMAQTLNQLDGDCYHSETFLTMPNAIKCVVAFPSNVEFSDQARTGLISGLAINQSFLVASFTATDKLAVTTPYNGSWLSNLSELFIHEFMHLMSLGHANCGGPSMLDSRLYADGSIGTNGAGHDNERGFYFANTDGGFSDFMSYCFHSRWTSDRAYRVIMAFKDSAKAGTTPAPSPSGPDNPASAPERLIRFSEYAGKWHATTSPLIPNLQRYAGADDAGFIHPELAGQPVWAPNSHVGQLRQGPLYIPETPEILNALRSGRMSTVEFRERKGGAP